MSRRRWTGIIAGVAIFLAAFGAALAVTVFQVSREIESEIVLSGVEVLSDDNLGIYHDRDLTEPVTFMEFRGAALVSPLDGGRVEPVWVYIVNHSDKGLTLIEPCRDIEDAEGRGIAHIFAEIHNLEGEWISNTCERDVALAPGEVVWVAVQIDIRESAGPGRYPFAVVFGAVGEEAPPPARIAFTSTRDGNGEIYVMDADGSNQTRLTDDLAPDSSPAWSPDGTRIAFTSDRSGVGNTGIYVMNPDGIGEADLGAAGCCPSWSPDGRQIAFQKFGDDWHIYIMNADGSNQTPLTTGVSPSWSAVGGKIAFTSDRDGNSEIYVMDADRSNHTRITNSPSFDVVPTWSPDGSKIAFESGRDGNSEIYVMDAEGANVTRLTNDPADDAEPAWSGDGTKIVFQSDRDGNFEIYVMDANGSNPIRLTSNSVFDISPDWSHGVVAPKQPVRETRLASAWGYDGPSPVAGSR